MALLTLEFAPHRVQYNGFLEIIARECETLLPHDQVFCLLVCFDIVVKL